MFDIFHVKTRTYVSQRSLLGLVVVSIVVMLLAAPLAVLGVDPILGSPPAVPGESDVNFLRFGAVTNGGSSQDQVYSLDEAVALAQRYDFIVALRWTFDDYVDEMRAANENLTILAYMDGSFSKPKDAASMPDSWFLKDESGARVYSIEWGNFYMDPASQGWRDWVSQRCILWTELSGFDGCMLDDMGAGNFLSNNLSGHPVDPRTGLVMDSYDWISYASGLVAHVEAVNEPSIVLANGIGSGPKFFGNNVVSSRLLEQVDMGMAEGFLRFPSGSVDSFRSQADWLSEVNMLAAAGQMDKPLIVQTKFWVDASEAETLRWRKYTYATFLLGTDGSSFLNFSQPGPGRAPALHEFDDVALGGPLGEYTFTSGVFQRKFVGGIAMVNPSKVPVVVSLDASYERLDGSMVSSFTLGANEGEILVGSGPVLGDVVDPEGFVDMPVARSVVSGPVVSLSGSAFDDEGVSSVLIAVRNTQDKSWLQFDGVSFGDKYRLLPAVLDAPGEVSSSWSLDVVLPAGSFAVQVKAVDLSSNRDQSPPWVPFTVEVPVVDVTPPVVSVASPVVRSSVSGTPVMVSGSVSDNVAVAKVFVAVRDTDAKLWLQHDGLFASEYYAFPVLLDAPGEVASSWSLDVVLPSGSFAVSVKAFDSSDIRNIDPPWVVFNVK